jgi:hypothetical protein
MVILMQSHRTGFYAWDQADEDGADWPADMQQLPWDVQPDSWQQPQQLQQVQPELPAAYDLGSSAGAVTTTHDEQQQEQQHQPKLRMLVYVHCEQLLQVLPWQLPQQLQLPQLPVLGSLPAVARHIASRGSAALWVHIDVCQLHGGHKLGSCVAPLAIAGLGKDKLVFEAQQQSVLVALYNPANGKNSSHAGQDASQQQQQQQQLRQTGQEEEDCEVMLLGKDRIGGSSSSVSSSSGLRLESAAEVLLELVGRDEVSSASHAGGPPTLLHSMLCYSAQLL